MSRADQIYSSPSWVRHWVLGFGFNLCTRPYRLITPITILILILASPLCPGLQ